MLRSDFDVVEPSAQLVPSVRGVRMFRINDVILGRGSGPANANGSIRFREIVWSSFQEYMSSRREAPTGNDANAKVARLDSVIKNEVARIVMQKFKNEGDGRFLRKITMPEVVGNSSGSFDILGDTTVILTGLVHDGPSSKWYKEVSDGEAMEKIKQSLRFLFEKQEGLTRSSSVTRLRSLSAMERNGIGHHVSLACINPTPPETERNVSLNLDSLAVATGGCDGPETFRSTNSMASAFAAWAGSSSAEHQASAMPSPVQIPAFSFLSPQLSFGMPDILAAAAAVSYQQVLSSLPQRLIQWQQDQELLLASMTRAREQRQHTMRRIAELTSTRSVTEQYAALTNIIISSILAESESRTVPPWSAHHN